MTSLLLFVNLAFALILAPWFGLMALIVGAALWGRFVARKNEPNGLATTRFLFVIPAHDESSVIGITVRSCLAVAYAPDRFQVFVIADNCSDDTASVAEAAGAEVMVRTDLARKSKGFALEDFFRSAPTNPTVHPFDAYVLVDADTSVAPDLLEAFDRSIRRGDDFIQGYYTVRNADVSWRTRLMTFAFSLANGVWLAGLDQLGLSGGLKGNGMCFRAEALRRFPWKAHGLVEDMEFAWNLRVGGERVRFQPEAKVYGEMVSRGGAGAASQRQRWESGRKALRSSFRRQLWQSSRLSWLTKLLYQIELSFPPLGRLVAGLGLASAVLAICVLRSVRLIDELGFTGIILNYWILFGIYLLSPVLIVGLPVRYLLTVLHVPYYLAWKLAVSVVKKPQQWIRTPREASSPKT